MPNPSYSTTFRIDPLNPQLFYNSNLYFEQIVNRYNECVKPTASIKRERKRVQTEIGLLVGTARNNWYYRPNRDPAAIYWNPSGAYTPLYTGTVGGFITFSPQKRLSLVLEGMFTMYKGSREVVLTNSLDPIIQTRLYSFEEHYVALPITARYVVVDRSVRWYVKGGLVPTIGTRVKGGFTSVAISDYDILLRAGIGVGYLAGIGADFPVAKGQHLHLEIRTMPHAVLYAVTRIANSRSLQFSVSIPLMHRKL